MNEHFENSTHALRAGLLIGLLMKEGIQVEPVMDGKDYTDVLSITVPVDDRGWNNVVVEVRVLPPKEKP